MIAYLCCFLLSTIAQNFLVYLTYTSSSAYSLCLLYSLLRSLIYSFCLTYQLISSSSSTTGTTTFLYLTSTGFSPQNLFSCCYLNAYFALSSFFYQSVHWCWQSGIYLALPILFIKLLLSCSIRMASSIFSYFLWFIIFILSSSQLAGFILASNSCSLCLRVLFLFSSSLSFICQYISHLLV